MEQSATPWRVFDAPSNDDGPGAAGATPPAAQAATPVGIAGQKPAVVGIVAAVLIGAIAVVVAVAGSGGQVIDAPAASLGAGNQNAMLTVGGDVVVDVSGAVTKPGVYRLPAGSRIGDAIDAAGGFSPRVDADRAATTLNLAETLKDGAQVHVPSRDDAAGSGSAGGGGISGASGTSGSGGGGLVNLNSATQSELEGLPGIGPVTATKIIESRTTTPFTSVDQLRERKLVGEKAFEQLRALVTVQ